MDPAQHLPKKAPKKTGKAGIKALDPDADFDTPVTKTPEEKLEALDKTSKTTTSLLIKQPDTPSVANGRMRVFYDRPALTKHKDVTLIALKLTMPLTDKHGSLLPKIVSDGYDDMRKKGRSRMNLRDIPPQRAVFYLESDRKQAMVTLPAAKVISANLSVIQRKGEGSAREVIRFAFHLQCEISDSISAFAEKNLQNDFWIELDKSQKDLWDSDK